MRTAVTLSLLVFLSLGLPSPAWAEPRPVDGGDEAEDSDENEDSDRDEDDEEQPSVSTRVQVSDRRGQPSTAQWTHQQAASVVALDLDGRDGSFETLADVLEEVAGLHVRRFGGPSDPAWVTIRGSSARQVEIYVDGIPLNAQGSSAVNLTELDLDGFERVEVYRGFAPPELGSSPMGGVIHLTSRPGSRSPPRMEVGLGSWTTRKVSAGMGGSRALRAGGFADFRMALSYAGTEGNFRYLDNRGTESNLLDDRMPERANNAHNQLDASALTRVVSGPLSLSFGDFFLWSDSEVPGHLHQQAEQAQLGVIQNLAVLRATFEPREHVRLHGDLAWRLRQESFEDPLGEIGLGRPSARQLFQQASGGLTAALQPLPWLELSPTFRTVLDHYSSELLHTGATAPEPRQRVALSASFAARIEPWDGLLSVQPSIGILAVDNRQLGVSEIAKDEASSASSPLLVAPTPRVAVAVRPTDWLTLRAAGQVGLRPPSFSELFGDRGGVIGNTYLLPEQSRSIDAGVRLRAALPGRVRASFELGGFDVRSEDTIVFLANSQHTVVPANFGATRVSGLELAGRLNLLEHIELSGALTWSDSEITEGLGAHLGNRLPHVPALEIDAGLQLRWSPWLSVRYQLRHTAGSHDSATNLFLTPPRTTHSLRIRLTPDNDLPWVGIELHNLSDERLFVRPRDPLSPDPDDRIVVPVEDFRGNPLAGRSVFVSIGWTPPPPRRAPDSLERAEDTPVESEQ